MGKLRVAIIGGGRSGEHEVSLISAGSVSKAIPKERFEVICIGIDWEGSWWMGDDVFKLLQEKNIAGLKPIRFSIHPANPGIFDDATGEKVAVDVFFPVLHGPNGEDGTIQGAFDLACVPYVGCGVLASSAGMDKEIMKALFANIGLKQVPYTACLRSRWQNDRNGLMEHIKSTIGFPCFVKPANLGSSVGISKAKDDESLRAALELAFQYDRKVVVEKGIDAREIEVSVLGNDDIKASVAGEIVPCNEFYDYEAKYISNGSALFIPAEITDEQMQDIRNMAIIAFQAIDGSGLARMDFFIEKGTGEVYINEVNTLPGFTSISMYPKLWEASGLKYADLLVELIKLALERHQDRNKNVLWR